MKAINVGESKIHLIYEKRPSVCKIIHVTTIHQDHPIFRLASWLRIVACLPILEDMDCIKGVNMCSCLKASAQLDMMSYFHVTHFIGS